MAFADLHMHSNASDGICNPDRIAQEAVASSPDVRVLALTDHDTLAGLDAAARSCKAQGIAFVPGVEITTKHDDRAVHLLGYFVDPSSDSLSEYLRANKETRAKRAFKMAELLAEDGFPVSADDLKDASTVPNRPLLARLLVERGCVSDVDEAFKTLLNSRSKYYVDAVYPETLEAIEFIKETQGHAFIAHPARYRIVDLIDGFARAGITGIEAYHSLQTPEQSRELIALADQLGLAVSGGSDWHGDTMHQARPGCCGLNEEEFEAFLHACGQS